jgi:hypothetical protein
MHFQSLLAAAMLCKVSLAGFNVHLYEKSGCHGSIGHTCTNIAARSCCSDGSKKFHSAEFNEEGSSCDDTLKVYPGDGSDKCGGLVIDQETYPTCVSAGSKDVTGAKVFIVIKPKSRRDLDDEEVEYHDDITPSPHVVPDETFFLNGTIRHVIALDTAEGQALALLERDEDRVEHLVRFGRREAVVENKCKKPKKGSRRL